jgi:uncharacterized protein with PIN domain
MSRIQKAYEIQFRNLLREIGARRPEQGIKWLLKRAETISEEGQAPVARTLTRVHNHLMTQVEIFRRHRAAKATNCTAAFGAGLSRESRELSPRPCFLCDAGLGGLARWLRAAGYDSLWQPDIDDAELVRTAMRIAATHPELSLLTTDSLLMERRLLRDGIIRALWLPPTLIIAEQLALVFREFRLTIREARCMKCGGELRRVEKESVRDRIPPRTYRWLDEYFVCVRCDQLFWRGTHWQKISRALEPFTSNEARSLP